MRFADAPALRLPESASQEHFDRDVPAELRDAGFRTLELTETAGDGPSWSGYTYEGVAGV